MAQSRTPSGFRPAKEGLIILPNTLCQASALCLMQTSQSVPEPAAAAHSEQDAREAAAGEDPSANAQAEDSAFLAKAATGRKRRAAEPVEGATAGNKRATRSAKG